MERFKDKISVVTGAGSGIGAATALRLASEGSIVVVVDLDSGAAAATVEKIKARGGSAVAKVADVSDVKACNLAVKETIDAFGRIDILVNNAGISRRGDILSITEDDWHQSFAVNLDSMFYLCRAALPHMIAAGGGVIVNTSSQWGLHPQPKHIAYNVTKAAIASFSQNLARDYAPHKVRVNAVCPGDIQTPLLESGLTAAGGKISDFDRLVPIGRIGQPEDVAALIAFIASDEAGFMCGSLVEITGARAVGC